MDGTQSALSMAGAGETRDTCPQPPEKPTQPSTGIFLDDPANMRCYCGKDRNPAAVELQCGMCSRFYHAECLSENIGPCVPFMTNYQFFCTRCNSSGSDHFAKKQQHFSQMGFTAVANLTLMHPGRKYFSKDREIIPFIEKYWEHMTTQPRRVKPIWHSTIAKTMMKDVDIFAYHEDVPADPHFCLLNDDLMKIGPNAEFLLKLIGTYKSSEPKVSSTSDTRRGPKRKTVNESQSVGVRTRRGEVGCLAKTTPTSYPLEHPFNKDGYRYILAEPDPHAANRQAFDESSEWAGKPIPGYLYRMYLERTVMLSAHDRAPQLKMSADNRLTVTGEKGYSMIRATHGVSQGAWFFEATVDEMPAETATRIGWSQLLGNLQAPCGYDKFSYSWRSRKGTAFHQSKGKHYSDGYSEKDVLGFYISLPNVKVASKLTPPIYKDRPLVKFKAHLYYEEKDNVNEAEKTLRPAKGSKMTMYKNGEVQQVAFEDIFEGIYYPAVSLYKNATISLNFGPDFKHPPKDQGDYKPMQEAAAETVVEHALGDILYHVEHEGQLPEF